MTGGLGRVWEGVSRRGWDQTSISPSYHSIDWLDEPRGPSSWRGGMEVFEVVEAEMLEGRRG